MEHQEPTRRQILLAIATAPAAAYGAMPPPDDPPPPSPAVPPADEQRRRNDVRHFETMLRIYDKLNELHELADLEQERRGGMDSKEDVYSDLQGLLCFTAPIHRARMDCWKQLGEYGWCFQIPLAGRPDEGGGK